MEYQSDASAFPTGGAMAAMPGLDPLGTQPAPRHLTQTQNDPAALTERGAVNFEVAEDARSIAYRQLACKSLDVVSTAKNTGDDHDRQHTPQG